MVNDKVGASNHHKELNDPHCHIAQRHTLRHQPIGVELCLTVAAVVASKQLALVIFVRKSLHDSDAADILFNSRVEVSYAPKERTPSFGHGATVAGGDKRHWRNNKPGDKGES